jgi:hypothetical protein
VTTELATSLAFLRAQREVVLAIINGPDRLADEHLRQSVPVLGWSPLGLVQHLAHTERYWFAHIAAGQRIPVLDDDWHVPANCPSSDVFSLYRNESARSDTVITSLRLSAPPAVREDHWPTDDVPDLRWIVLHMIEETARHAGHLDIARQLLDGHTGLGPR